MKNQFDSLTTKEKIIKVTMDIIAKEGFQNITIRKIAKQAGVNVAAVNYHFGSKDAVINAALETVTNQLKYTFKYLQSSQEEPKIKLSIFIVNYTDMMYKYPDILKNVIDHAIHDKPLDRHMEYMTFLETEGVEILKQTLVQIRPELDDYTLYLKILHLLSGLSFPFLMGDQIQKIMGVDLYSEDIRKIHTTLLLDNICR